MRVPFPALALWAGCPDTGPQAVPPEAPKPIQRAEIPVAPTKQPRAFAGVVRARREADIAFRASGRIAARRVDRDAVVTEGQELARIDPAVIAARRGRTLALAEWRAISADMAAASSRVPVLMAGPSPPPCNPASSPRC